MNTVKPLLDEITDERVLRPQVEHVIFHDPCRHDQERLGDHGLGRGLVLNELHQLVAVDNLSRRNGQSLAELEVVGFRSRLPGKGPQHVVLEVGRAAHEIGAGLVPRALDDRGVQPGKVRGRPDIEHLVRHEADPRGIFRRHAAHFARCLSSTRIPRREKLAATRERALGAKLRRRSAGRRVAARKGGSTVSERLLGGETGKPRIGVWLPCSRVRAAVPAHWRDAKPNRTRPHRERAGRCLG